jgi:sec-independent protein translocase protein TatC
MKLGISPHDKRMELTEHLGELRGHIIKSIWYLILGAIIAYQFFAPIYGFLYRPLMKEMTLVNQERTKKEIRQQIEEAPVALRPYLLNHPYATHDPPSKADFDHLVDALVWERLHPVQTPMMSQIFTNFFEPFMVQLKVSMILGFILVLPLVMWEFTKFILPALTPQERRPLRMLVPLSALLLACGVTIAYVTMFFAMHWFLGYLDNFPQPAVLMQNPGDYVVFMLKMMAAFGVAFQLPVVLMGLAFAGLVTSKGLIKQWRWGLVIAVLGGVFTPANDPMSWALMVFPLLALYFGSYFLVKHVERIKSRSKPA